MFNRLSPVLSRNGLYIVKELDKMFDFQTLNKNYYYSKGLSLVQWLNSYSTNQE